MSKPVMNAELVRAWKAGQDAANRREIVELRKTPMSTKLRQLAAMVCSADHFQSAADHFQSAADRESEVVIARERWQRIYRAYGH